MQLLVFDKLIEKPRLTKIIIKFPYNVHSDWLKECALSENRARVDYSKLAFKFLLRNFDKFAKLSIPVIQTNAMETSYLSVVNMLTKTIASNSSVKTVLK